MTDKEHELYATLRSASGILSELQDRLTDHTNIALSAQLRSIVSQFSEILAREDRAISYADNFKTKE